MDHISPKKLAPETPSAKAYETRARIAAILAVLLSVAAGGLVYKATHPEEEDSSAEQAEPEKNPWTKKFEEEQLTVERVKEVWAGRGVELSDKAAKRLYEKAKKHLEERRAAMKDGDYEEFLPGAHFPKARADHMAEGHSLAGEVFRQDQNELAPVIQQNGKPMTNPNGDVILAAKPFAEILSTIAKEKTVLISDCFRSDIMQAILWAGIEGGGPVGEAGNSVHQTGLACDFTNMDQIEDDLAEYGIIGGCYGTMYGSDFNHGSIGEMPQRGDLKVAACKKMSPRQRAIAEKGGRVIRKARGGLINWCLKVRLCKQ